MSDQALIATRDHHRGVDGDGDLEVGYEQYVVDEVVLQAGSTPDGEQFVALEPFSLDDLRSVVREAGLVEGGSARVDVSTDGRASEQILVLELLSVLKILQVGGGDESPPASC